MNTSDETKDKTASDRDFWDLGGIRPRIYEKANFDSSSLSVTEITDGEDTTPHAHSEPIPSRSTHSPSVVRTIHGSRIVTDSYKNRSARGMRDRLNLPKKSTTEGVITASYGQSGPLILKTDVKSRSSDTEFYGKFAMNARRIHSEPYTPTADGTVEKVPYFSYVPQYSHMNRAQLEFYKAVRHSITEGKYPECDLSYILLFIYEIINLPDLIPPEDGVALLCGMWLGYRKLHPRLDT